MKSSGVTQQKSKATVSTGRSDTVSHQTGSSGKFNLATVTSTSMKTSSKPGQRSTNSTSSQDKRIDPRGAAQTSAAQANRTASSGAKSQLKSELPFPPKGGKDSSTSKEPVFKLSKTVPMQDGGSIWARLEPTNPAPIELAKAQSSQAGPDDGSQPVAPASANNKKKKAKRNKAKQTKQLLEAARNGAEFTPDGV